MRMLACEFPFKDDASVLTLVAFGLLLLAAVGLLIYDVIAWWRRR